MSNDKFTVQALDGFDLCEEMYFEDVPDCIKWATAYANDEDYVSDNYKIMNTEGALSFLEGKKQTNGTIKWDEVSFKPHEVPMVKPTWGIWDSP